MMLLCNLELSLEAPSLKYFLPSAGNFRRDQILNSSRAALELKMAWAL